MQKLSKVLVIGLLVASCGGTDESTNEGTTDPGADVATETPDPCALAGDEVLLAYFGEPFAGEPGEAGPIQTCSWRDASANSLLIQVASDFPLNRLDPCEGCIDLTFGDDGFATESPLQSTATFVSGATWYSVTTTGFGDDAATIANLAETIFENATG